MRQKAFDSTVSKRASCKGVKELVMEWYRSVRSPNLKEADLARNEVGGCPFDSIFIYLFTTAAAKKKGGGGGGGIAPAKGKRMRGQKKGQFQKERCLDTLLLKEFRCWLTFE